VIASMSQDHESTYLYTNKWIVCRAINKVYLGNAVTTIHSSAFKHCYFYVVMLHLSTFTHYTLCLLNNQNPYHYSLWNSNLICINMLYHKKLYSLPVMKYVLFCSVNTSLEKHICVMEIQTWPKIVNECTCNLINHSQMTKCRIQSIPYNL